MRYSWLFAFSVLSSASHFLALPRQPHWGDMRVKHAWNAVPSNWEHLGHAVTETMIDLYIALKPQRENALIDALYEVSDPGHTKYGAHLSREQVAGLVAPHPNTLELINSWLEHHGVPSSSVSTSHGGGWLTVTGVPVSRANALLGTSYQLYQHVETKDRVLRTLGYSLPEVLHAHVKTVAPTTYFGSPRNPRQMSRKRSGVAAGGIVRVPPALQLRIRPEYLRWRYGMQSYEPAGTDRNVLGITGYFGEYPSQDDLTVFMNRYHTEGADATFALRQVGGGSLLSEPSSESNLEIQYTEAITYPTRHVYYSTVSNLRFLIWLDAMLGGSDIPQTISTSYSDNERDFPRDYALAVCELFAQLGLRGASVIAASGDDGVGSGTCLANDGSGRTEFLPKFPATCPWLTSVGGTVPFYPGWDTSWEGGEEVAAPSSSGGFSKYFPRPPYQDDAAFNFFQVFGTQLREYYNPSGRGFPDVSAITEVFEYVFMGRVETQWGTGCSTPTVAGVISLLNGYLLSKNRNPLGWLNPWLYRYGRAGFHDVTSGSNPGCGTGGFTAIDGWDPVTGFGSPKFQELLRIVETMPTDLGHG